MIIPELKIIPRLLGLGSYTRGLWIEYYLSVSAVFSLLDRTVFLSVVKSDPEVRCGGKWVS